MAANPAGESTLKISEDQGVAIVGFKDASILDAHSIQRIGKELCDLLDVQNRTRLLLDFGEVRFLSSQALGILLTLKKKCDKAGAKLALARLRPELARVFKITNLDQVFKFYDNRDDALKMLAS